MDYRMSAKECAILRNMREMHPDANGLITFITKADANEVPCCFSRNPAASDDRIIAMGFEIGDDEKQYVWEMDYTNEGFEWMGEYMPDKGRTSAFYYNPDSEDDLVTGL